METEKLGLLAISLATGFSACAQQKVLDRPNILCIVCEDISPFLGCYGDTVAHTPNLDRLASQSVRYTNMHTTVGVSSPSRFSLITGMYSSGMCANHMRTMGDKPEYLPAGISSYEVVTPAGIKCYSEYMRAAGYYCINGPKTDYQFKAPFAAWDYCGNKASLLEHPDGMPFFAIVNLGVTHESQIWERASMPLVVDPSCVNVPPYYPDTPTVRHDLAVLYSNIAEMDRQSQKIIDRLSKMGELDNTIIIWYSDNGGPLPRGKREIYLSGTRVPFMIRYPDGYRAGDVDERLCMFVDIPATILSLAGIRPPHYMQGRPFAGNYAKKARRYVYGARDRMDEKIDKQGGVFDGRYHLMVNYMPDRSDYLDIVYQNNIPMMREMKELYEEGKLNEVQSLWFNPSRPRLELYDTCADPYEVVNLAGNDGYAPIIRRLRKEYDRWLRKFNKEWFTPERESMERFAPEGKQPKVSQARVRSRNGKITLSCRTEGASLSYRINGQRWLLYTGAFLINKGDSLEIIGSRIGLTQSDVISYRQY